MTNKFNRIKSSILNKSDSEPIVPLLGLKKGVTKKSGLLESKGDMSVFKSVNLSDMSSKNVVQSNKTVNMKQKKVKKPKSDESEDESEDVNDDYDDEEEGSNLSSDNDSDYSSSQESSNDTKNNLLQEKMAEIRQEID